MKSLAFPAAMLLNEFYAGRKLKGLRLCFSAFKFWKLEIDFEP
jgi:hypothetical protein